MERTEVELHEGVCESTEEASIPAWGGGLRNRWALTAKWDFDRKSGIREHPETEGTILGAEKNTVGVGEPSISFEWL